MHGGVYFAVGRERRWNGEGRVKWKETEGNDEIGQVGWRICGRS